jgi:hypothetical protein
MPNDNTTAATSKSMSKRVKTPSSHGYLISIKQPLRYRRKKPNTPSKKTYTAPHLELGFDFCSGYDQRMQEDKVVAMVQQTP